MFKKLLSALVLLLCFSSGSEAVYSPKKIECEDLELGGTYVVVTRCEYKSSVCFLDSRNNLICHKK